MVATLGTTRKPNLPYDAQQSTRTPAGARSSNDGEIQEIPRSSTQGDRIEFAKKSRPHFSGNADKSGDGGEASGSGNIPEAQGADDANAARAQEVAGDGQADAVSPSEANATDPNSMEEIVAKLDAKVQALAKNQNIALEVLPKESENQYKLLLCLFSGAVDTLANISGMDQSKFVETMDQDPGTLNMLQELLHSRLGLQLDTKVQALAKEKNIALPKFTMEQEMGYPNALQNAVKALYQVNNEGSRSIDEQREAEEAILNNLLAIRQNDQSDSQNGQLTAEEIAGDATAGADAEHVHNGARTGNQTTGRATAATGGEDLPPPTNGEQGEQTVERATGSQPLNNNTDTKPKTNETTPKTDTDKNKTEEEGGGIMKGWIKTKVLTGAALLAGGIALKLTLIGIIPGLIMAGVGAALMGWGGINYATKK